MSKKFIEFVRKMVVEAENSDLSDASKIDQFVDLAYEKWIIEKEIHSNRPNS